MKPHAHWGAAFAFLATAIAAAMIHVIAGIAGAMPASAPLTPLDFRDAYLPVVTPLAHVIALDQMFTLAYGAAFVGAALAWPRPTVLCLGAIAAGLATAGIDCVENISTAVALSGLHERPPSMELFQRIQLLGALKWVGGGAASLAIAGLMPRRGVLFILVAGFLGLGGLAELTLGAVRLGLIAPLSPVEPALAGAVIAALPVGLLLLGVALLSEARHRP